MEENIDNAMDARISIWGFHGDKYVFSGTLPQQRRLKTKRDPKTN